MAKPDIDFESMTAEELFELKVKIDEIAQARRAEAIRLFRDKAMKEMKGLGVTPEEVFGVSTHAASKSRANQDEKVVRYRDPANPGNTWAGRGKMPKWLSAQIRSGRSKKDFLVSND